MNNEVKNESIAKICHEANRAYCAEIGDNSQPPWEEAPEWQRESAIKGVEFALANPDVTPEMSHVSWTAVKIAEGWVFGEEKNPDKKTHPCLVPYHSLPENQQLKDALFLGVIGVFRGAVNKQKRPKTPLPGVKEDEGEGQGALLRAWDRLCEGLEVGESIIDLESNDMTMKTSVRLQCRRGGAAVWLSPVELQLLVDALQHRLRVVAQIGCADHTKGDE